MQGLADARQCESSVKLLLVLSIICQDNSLEIVLPYIGFHIASNSSWKNGNEYVINNVIACLDI